MAPASSLACGFSPTYGLVVCRDTEEEAKRDHQRIIDEGDWPGARNLMSIIGVESQSFRDPARSASVAPPLASRWTTAAPRRATVGPDRARFRVRDGEGRASDTGLAMSDRT